jgi:hypothetical protein
VQIQELGSECGKAVYVYEGLLQTNLSPLFNATSNKHVRFSHIIVLGQVTPRRRINSFRFLVIHGHATNERRNVLKSDVILGALC